MAVRPIPVKKADVLLEGAMLRCIEAYLDDILMHSMEKGDRSILVDFAAISKFGALNRRIVDKIIETYQDNGWIVEVRNRTKRRPAGMLFTCLEGAELEEFEQQAARSSAMKKHNDQWQGLVDEVNGSISRLESLESQFMEFTAQFAEFQDRLASQIETLMSRPEPVAVPDLSGDLSQLTQRFGELEKSLDEIKSAPEVQHESAEEASGTPEAEPAESAETTADSIENIAEESGAEESVAETSAAPEANEESNALTNVEESVAATPESESEPATTEDSGESTATEPQPRDQPNRNVERYSRKKTKSRSKSRKSKRRSRKNTGRG